MQDVQLKIDKKTQAIRRKIKSIESVSKQVEPKTFQGTLREYQRVGLGWLKFMQKLKLGGCLADDMGLGKTIQVLALLEERRIEKQAKTSSLVIVPKSLIYNWIDEAKRFTPNLLIYDYSGTARKDIFNNNELMKYDLIVASYGIVRRDIALFKDHVFDYCIIDEAQAIKNRSSQTAKAIKLINATHRLALSGTPVENHLGELFSIFEFLTPGLITKKLGTKLANQLDETTIALLNGLRPFILRRTKEKVLKDLPPKIESIIYCDFDTKERKLYDELRDYYRNNLDDIVKNGDFNKKKIVILEGLLRLRQASLHPALIDKKSFSHESAKLKTLIFRLKEITSAGHKALVFSQFTELLTIIKKELKANDINYTYLDGKSKNRKELVDNFQSDNSCKVFLISLKAGGVGLNLTSADYCFIMDPWWNPAVESQAIDRTHRIGQTKKVMAYRLISRDTIEEKIIELQKSKKRLAENIITADQGFLKQLRPDDLRFLLS